MGKGSESPGTGDVSQASGCGFLPEGGSQLADSPQGGVGEFASLPSLSHFLLGSLLPEPIKQ